MTTMPNPTPEALVALVAVATGKIVHVYNGECPDEIEGHDRLDPACPACQAIEAALASREPAAQPEAAPAGGEAVDLIPWLYVIRSEFLPDDASLGRESDRKMREALDWATNAMRDRAALSQSQSAQAGGDEPFAYVRCEGRDVTSCAELVWPRNVRKGKRGAKAAWRELPPGLHPLYLAPPASPAAPAVPDVEMARHWIDRYATGIDDECQMDRVCEALGVTLAAAQKDGA